MTPGNPTALLIDDDLRRRHTLAESLSLIGWTSVSASTPLNAIRQLTERRVDVAFVAPLVCQTRSEALIEYLSEAHPLVGRILVADPFPTGFRLTREVHAILPVPWSLFELVTATSQALHGGPDPATEPSDSDIPSSATAGERRL